MAIETVDAVATFCDATRANDVDRIVSTLAPDAELLSPLSGRMVFRGRDDLRVLLGAVYGGLSGLTWREVIGDGATRVAGSDGRVPGVTITQGVGLQLDDTGVVGRVPAHPPPRLGPNPVSLLPRAEKGPLP